MDANMKKKKNRTFGQKQVIKGRGIPQYVRVLCTR